MEFVSHIPIPERIYRLRLCEGIFREVTFRGAQAQYRSENDPGVVEDMLRLKDGLPMPNSEEHVKSLEGEIRAMLESCQSELVREIPVANLAHYMLMAYRASLQPYWPTSDELVLL